MNTRYVIRIVIARNGARWDITVDGSGSVAVRATKSSLTEQPSTLSVAFERVRSTAEPVSWKRFIGIVIS